MTPENRARLHTVLRESLSRAVLPASSAYAKERAAHGPFAKSSSVTAAAAAGATATGPAGGAGAAGRDAAAMPEPLVDRFRREAEALTVHVYQVKDEEEATASVVGVLKALHAKTVLAWAFSAIGLPQLPGALHQAAVTCVSPEVPFDPRARAARLAEMADAAAGITGAAAGLADTGSLVLAHGPARGRLASLLPPVHIAVLRRHTIVGSFGQLLERNPSLPEAGSNLVLVTGPSRTADIEQTLTRGVHGPREVHVVLL